MASTNVENPVNEIASLLAGNAPQKKEETLEADTEQEETLDVSDESQSQDESLAKEDEDQSEETTDEEGLLDTINNLAEELDVPIEDMYALNLKLSKSENLPDGGAITLGELKNFYEKNVDIENLRETLTTREQELQAQSETVSEVPQVSNELMQARAQVLAIQNAYENVDWNGIRHNNPGEYAALQADFRNKFDAAKQQETVADQQYSEHRAQNAAYQRDRLFEAIPALKDDEVRVKVATDVQNYASKYGFTAKDIESIEDHRIMRLLIEASKTDMAKASAKEKKVDKTPTASKASATRPIPGRNAALKRLTEKAKASGSTKDRTNAIAALIG